MAELPSLMDMAASDTTAGEVRNERVGDCDRIVCPWCCNKLVHLNHSMLVSFYTTRSAAILEGPQSVDTAFQLHWLNVIITSCEADLRGAQQAYNPIQLFFPAVTMPPPPPGPSAASGSAVAPKAYGVWGPPGTAHVAPADDVTVAVQAEDEEPKRSRSKKQPKLSAEERYGWMRRLESMQQWYEHLKSAQLTIPDRSYRYEFVYWKSNKAGWTPTHPDNNEVLERILLGPDRMAKAVELVNDAGNKLTYSVYFHEQLEGVQYNVFSGTWRELRACPRPKA